MAQNRYLAYGYLVKDGKIQLDVQESLIVRQIFSSHAKGLSYQKIADQLTDAGHHYTASKAVWNKNMIARILQNRKYFGTEQYPPIVDQAMLDKIGQAKRSYSHTASADIKALKPLLTCQCGQKLQRTLRKNGQERWKCQADIEHISAELTDEIIIRQMIYWQKFLANTGMEQEKNCTNIETLRLENELNRLLSQVEIDVPIANKLIYQLATAKYNECAEIDYVSQHIMQELGKADSLQVELIKKVITKIELYGDKIVSITIKNGHKIEIEKGAET